MKQGLYKGIKERAYGEIEAVRSSDLKLLLKSPAHYKAEKDGFGKPPSPQLQHSWDVGDAFHAALLEPDRFEKDFILMPTFSGKGSKLEKETWLLDHPYQTYLTEEDYQLINNMKVSVMNHPEARQLLNEDGLTEVTGIFTEPEFNVPCKIRVDRLNKIRGIPIDLKSSGVEIYPESAWSRRAYNLDYHISGYFYTRGLSLIAGANHTSFIHIVVEKDYPHGVMVYEMTEDLLLYGGADVNNALRIWRECTDSGEWPCYPTGIHTLGLPKWARPKSEVLYG